MDHNVLDQFKEKEIRGLRRLKYFMNGFFVAVPLLLFTYITYSGYINFVERNIPDKCFLQFALPLSGVLLLFFLFFFPIILFTRYRVNRIIKLLLELDEEHLRLYQHYTKVVPRLSANIPPYLFSENSVIIPKLFSIDRVPYSSIMEISYKKFRSGRNYSTNITLETYNNRKHQVSFYLEEKLRFFLDAIAQKQLHIPVINKNK